MRVLVTGGAGYIGSACLRRLLAHGHEPVALDDLSAGNREAVPDAGDRLVVGDIRDGELVRQTLAERGIEAVMHFAALASVPESIKDPDGYYRVNFDGTKVLLDACREAGVRRFVFSSTAATYGLEGEMPLREDSPQRPEVPYGRSKLAAEWLIRDYCRAYDMGCAIFRYFNASGADPDGEYGESRDHETHLIPLVFAAVLGTRPPLKVFGTDFPTPDGTCVRDYIHTDDLAQAHQLALEQIEPGDQRIYNLGSGHGHSVLEVLRACERAVGRKAPHEMAPPRPGDPATLIADPSAAITELGWKPQFTDLNELVRTAWQWHERYPCGYPSKKNS